MTLPAGRRQEFAGLFLARAVLGHLRRAAEALLEGFAVEDQAHFGSQIQQFGQIIVTSVDVVYTASAKRESASTSFVKLGD